MEIRSFFKAGIRHPVRVSAISICFRHGQKRLCPDMLKRGKVMMGKSNFKANIDY